MEKNPHAGHRERMKKLYIAQGMENMDPHRALELLLFFGIPQKDTNGIAHDLIETFGCFSQVFHASVDGLRAVSGMTENAAILVNMIPSLYRKVAEDELKQDKILSTSEKMGEFLLPRFVGRSEETVFLLCLNSSCKLLRCDLIGEGGANHANINVRKVVEIAISCHAVNVVIAHNHPNGMPRPSNQDISTTKRTHMVLRQLNIELLDHFIISQGKWESLMEMGYLGVSNVREGEMGVGL